MCLNICKVYTLFLFKSSYLLLISGPNYQTFISKMYDSLPQPLNPYTQESISLRLSSTPSLFITQMLDSTRDDDMSTFTYSQYSIHSGDPLQFLNHLRFSFTYEMARVGCQFLHPNGIRIQCYMPYQIKRKFDVSSIELVELSTPPRSLTLNPGSNQRRPPSGFSSGFAQQQQLRSVPLSATARMPTSLSSAQPSSDSSSSSSSSSSSASQKASPPVKFMVVEIAYITTAEHLPVAKKKMASIKSALHGFVDLRSSNSYRKRPSS